MGTIWVALGSALGGVARYWLGLGVVALVGPAFPWGTLIINILGSFVIGWFGAITGPDGRWPDAFNARLFVMVGVCGGFTTFSAFSLQTMALARDGKVLQAGANVALSVILCLVAVAAGHALAQRSMG